MDDTLSVADMGAMRAHLEQCAPCARHDTRVRRSLLLVRNAPRVECSPVFGRRLEARIRAVGPVDRSRRVPEWRLPASLRYTAYAAALTAVAAAAALATDVLDRGTPEVRMAPVVASAPAMNPVPETITSPAYVASVMSGMPVWPAVLVAGQSSLHMANYEYQLTGYTR